MVCVPCFMIPFLLFLWRFIQPYVLMIWNPPKNEDDKDKGDGEAKDANYCPSALMCPCNKKSASPQIANETKTVEEKKED